MKQVDYTALRFNQAMIIGLLVLAFLFDQVWLIAFVAAVMLVGTLWPSAGLSNSPMHACYNLPVCCVRT